MIKGIPQFVEYNSSSSLLYYTVTDDDGLQYGEVDLSAVPKIAIYDPSGNEKVAATNMSAVAATTEGWLRYDGQTAEFSTGAVVTGGSSGSTARIAAQRKGGATGRLYVMDVDGTFADNDTLTDSEGGAADEHGTVFTAMFSYALDTTGTSDFPVGKNYSAKITYTISGTSQAFVRWLYFDVAFFPAIAPWVTPVDIDSRFPTLVGGLPEEWADWRPAIHAAHADLIRKLHSLGEQASYFVKREQEMWGIELAFTRAEISRALGEPREQVDRWEERASDAWASRGEFTFDSDDDQEIDDDVKVVSSRLTR